MGKKIDNVKHHLLEIEFNNAIESSNISVLQRCLDEGFNINHNNGYSLKQASINGDYNIVKFLVENNANVGFEKAVFWSGCHGYIKNFDYLLEKSNIVLKGETKEKIMMRALSYGYSDMIKHLVIKHHYDHNFLLTINLEYETNPVVLDTIEWVKIYKNKLEFKDKLESVLDENNDKNKKIKKVKL